MDNTTYLWFQYLDRKISHALEKQDTILNQQAQILTQLASPDPQAIAKLTGRIEAKTVELKKAVEAARPQ